MARTSLYTRTLPWLYPAMQTNRIKNYACRPYLYDYRIFTPKVSQGKKTLLPLVTQADGGFIVNYPAADDVLARCLGNQANCIVVSINYGKVPRNKFPAVYEDVIAQSLTGLMIQISLSKS